MDLDEAEVFEGMFLPEEDSGSAYEESSSNDGSLSEDIQPARQSARERSTASKRSSKSRRSSPEKEGNQRGGPFREQHQSERADIDNPIAEDAKEWAASFGPPAAEEIRTPLRHDPRPRKRRVQKAPTEIRYKRLRPYYDDDYREILNFEVHDAVYGEKSPDSLEQSQIGSSIWTTTEKDLLFSSLPRHGIDNVREIANYIGTKSELEVREFLRVLQASVEERKRKGRRDFMVADLPAAMEISEECCLVLERAGDALSVRQQKTEEKVEKSKWSDVWLIDAEVSRLIERRRKEEGGEGALDAVLPAGNLFITKHWLELSRRVFMNPGDPRADDNWEILAEPGETPAIRATALEDFHSLVVNITKKLVSTTLFCTMSRLRSGNYHYIKISEVTPEDVEAATNILGMKSNSQEFWLNCAKRNSLEVIDDGEDVDQREALTLTHEDVEEDLRSATRSRSRSLSRIGRGRTSSQASMPEEDVYSSPSEVDPEELRDFHSDSSAADDIEPLAPQDSPDFTDPESPILLKTDKTTRPQDRKAAERAQDAYAEAIDMIASRKEETRLWTMIEQEPPFEIETKVEDPARPLAIRDDIEDGRSWRDNLEYWSPWELMKTPVSSSAFRRNRERKSRRAKARAKGSWPRPGDEIDRHLALEEDLESVEERDEGTSRDSEASDAESSSDDQRARETKLEDERSTRHAMHGRQRVLSAKSIAVRDLGAEACGKDS